MKKNTLLEVPLPTDSQQEVLEKINKYLSTSTFGKTSMVSVISLNPENFVATTENKTFKEAVLSGQVCIIDGTGVVWAAHFLGMPVGERFTGVDLMDDLIKSLSNRRLRVALLGGRANLAKNLAECYSKIYQESQFVGLEGFKDIKNPTPEEEKDIFSIVAATRPHLMFVAFGSPYQELWLWQHREKLKGIVCIGVGGAFDFLSGEITRAPQWIRSIGLEWFFRLLVQPWRWRRQLKLFKFIGLVLKQKFAKG